MSPGDAQPGQPSSSSTPPRPNVPAHDATSSMKTTPNSRGAATVSEHIGLVGVEIEKIRPWVQHDIERAEPCRVDAMLQVLLQRVSLDAETEQPDLLGRCLKAVLPVCNGAAGKKPDGYLHSSGIKDALDTYVLKGVEEDFYEPFVKATNIALAFLEDVKVDGMRGASREPQIIFQKNDKNMTQSHQNTTARRKPDVVILPLQSSLNAFPADHKLMGDGEHSVENAPRKPAEQLLWKDALAVVEFKRKKKILPEPRSAYKVKEYIATKPEYLRVETGATDGPAVSSASQTQAKRPVAAAPPTRRSGRLAANSQPTTSNSSSKRKAEEPLQSSGKRAKVGETDSKLDVTVQTGLYAAEMFAANVAVKHILNLIVVGNYSMLGHQLQLTISHDSWCCYMRCNDSTSATWGRNTKFREVDEGNSHAFKFGDVDLLLHTSDEARVNHYGLKGRATNVIPVTSEYLANEYPEVQKDGMVAKIFWGEEQRTSEPDILKVVEEIAKKEKTVEGHVPHLLWHHEFKNPTSAVRKALGIAEPTKGSRVLYILVFRRFLPITDLEGEEFFNVWRQCILCHLALWKGGVHHRDVSPPNMMFYKTDEGVLMGVLNDFDLASLATTKGRLGNERTGTVPFMALELLTPAGQRGEVEHLVSS
ncbi:uncharacterized protein EDB91DRAFT_1248752 [Suillus paluster]|uniref:uncharacterized protein n=1 Tax=Suillus paluster TaxID=48578 RepID=UPI001B87ED51|nr:uncharacterized protein EDB91DRAFT_1248752 [Suillus paluster]KAG1739397.1 hypothetical protein EDB91DRAFT_1248752 [Suillus paluster]